MIILKEGDPDKLLETYKFVCKKCGCEFLASKEEYKLGWDQKEGVQYIHVECPMDYCKEECLLFFNGAVDKR